jgi:hypothetical protein
LFDTQEEGRLREIVLRAVRDVKATDIHTHLYAPDFGSLLYWGIDELLTYHYLVSETMRWIDMPYEEFWSLSKREQADLVWKTLFIERSPYSEACRGVLTVLQRFGLDTSSRNLEDYRAFFAAQELEDHIGKVLDLAGVDSFVMTNDPFDDGERPIWLEGREKDPRFRAALRLDVMLNSWENAYPALMELGYDVGAAIDDETAREVRRFLGDWIDRMDALYMAVSLPPTFAFPEDSARGKLIEECVLPVARERNIPFALMIGVKRSVNPALGQAGDASGKGDVETLEYLCSHYPHNKFLVTMLSRENQYELCIAARKFRNLLIFGCWWFMNNPVLIEEVTRMRFEMLGESVIPQHSDARVLEQLVYKWDHSRGIIGEILAEKYVDLAATGWVVSEEEIERDVEGLFGGNFWWFQKWTL